MLRRDFFDTWRNNHAHFSVPESDASTTGHLHALSSRVMLTSRADLIEREAK
jgi:hypothetical protein